MNKEEIVQRLKFVADEIDKDIKIFEETHNFEHIYQTLLAHYHLL